MVIDVDSWRETLALHSAINSHAAGLLLDEIEFHEQQMEKSNNALARCRDHIARLTAERDALIADVAHMQERSFSVNEEFAALRAERDVLRAVADAAQAYVNRFTQEMGRSVPFLKPEMKALIAAVDALAQTDTRP